MDKWMGYIIPILAAAIGAYTTYVVSKMNRRLIRREEALKDQYHKVFAPIHKILFFDNCEEDVKRKDIEVILSENYSIVPQPMTICWHGNYEHFVWIVKYCTAKSAYKLGYSRESNFVEKENVPEEALGVVDNKSEYWMAALGAAIILIAIFVVVLLASVSAEKFILSLNI